MKTAIKYVNLFTREGRLLKEIPVTDLPKELPDFISYAGNIYRAITFSNGYTECVPYVYEEKAHTVNDDILSLTPEAATDASVPGADLTTI
jgi:hypothetical protein